MTLPELEAEVKRLAVEKLHQMIVRYLDGQCTANDFEHLKDMVHLVHQIRSLGGASDE